MDPNTMSAEERENRSTNEGHKNYCNNEEQKVDQWIENKSTYVKGRYQITLRYYAISKLINAGWKVELLGDKDDYANSVCVITVE